MRVKESTFKLVNISIAVLFSIAFFFLVLPPLSENFDVLGAFAAGFVNPYASGYSTDVIFCWFILAVWVRYEAVKYSISHGWVCLLLGLVPGVAVGFALYLVLRQRQLRNYGDTHA
jgi:hypothetical protein